MSSKKSRMQRIFWALSVIIILSMLISLAVSFAPRRVVTNTPVPTWTSFPTRTPLTP